jgi:hypothetical protein
VTPRSIRPIVRIHCSLGSLGPATLEQWLDLAHHLEASLQGQASLSPADPEVVALAEKVRQVRGARAEQPPARSRGASGAGGRPSG